MRPAPYGVTEDGPDSTGNLVVLAEPPVRRRRPPAPRRLPPGIGARLGLAAALFSLGVVLGASWIRGPVLQRLPVPGGAAVTIGPATVGQISALYPGGTGDLSVAVVNPNSFPVRLSGGVAGSDCRDPALSLVHQLVVPPTLGRRRTLAFTDAVQMGLTASNDCQGQVLSITLSRIRVLR